MKINSLMGQIAEDFDFHRMGQILLFHYQRANYELPIKLRCKPC